MTAVHTDDPALVSGCRDCPELAAEDPGDENESRGREITAQGGVAPRRPARPARTAGSPDGEGGQRGYSNAPVV